jgi:diguanylate cyclase (GGDEF)-like protein
MPDSTVDIVPYAHLFDVIDEFIDECRQHSSMFGLLLVDINNFRRINLTHGFRAGDEVLAEVLRRMRQVSRKQDLVLRIGNSEFLFFIRNVHNEGHASLAAIKLLQVLDETIDTGNRQLKVKPCIGGALYPDHGQDSSMLLKSTESALLDARRRPESHSIFTEERDPDNLTTWNIESDLEAAIERDEFELHFQPQVEISSGRVYGAEALLRWKHSKRGYVRPSYFIPIAEQSNFIYEITNWTIRSALWSVTEWPQLDEPLKVSVNLSPKMFEQGILTESISDIGNIFAVSLECLTLEITETALMEQMSLTVQVLNELKDLGVNISIDDFGTGYSSMSYFKSIPANELKIDRSFVSNMMDNPMDLHIVRTITDMAQGFGLKVVAEGVENRGEFEFLNTLGCDIAQGNYISSPMPQTQFIDWFNQYNSVVEQISELSG